MRPLFVNLGVIAAVAGTVGVVAHTHGLATGQVAKWTLGGAALGALAVVWVAFEERMAPEDSDPTVQGARSSVITALGTMLVWILYGIVVRDPTTVVGGVAGLVAVAVVAAVRRRRQSD
jgi:MYXO-CTERM domain-containing protein